MPLEPQPFHPAPTRLFDAFFECATPAQRRRRALSRLKRLVLAPIRALGLMRAAR